jgi:hypothetical protein
MGSQGQFENWNLESLDCTGEVAEKSEAMEFIGNNWLWIVGAIFGLATVICAVVMLQQRDDK